ncbi:hypothetical protein NEOLEDRAFT_1152553 [Neolentinus lepideus HHB14362 ss-1]|uniref:Uncharacterized protein n=1 Tax=Neolentinus lepideus HHB14362 ss-1 TaxID=1314782 RepID=A0A165MNL2_9AGAM|nr:hypothetical protein NEOLEDRAFT_1152553 [Neolentinus lepideus HHB14362 ss-1]
MATYPRVAKKTRAPIDLEELRSRKPDLRSMKEAQGRPRPSSRQPTTPGLPVCPKQFLLSPPTPTFDRQSRWSDIIPPQTGLTFAAIWDPNDGMVTFSGPELQRFPEVDSDTKSSIDQPTTVTLDGQSQILTIDRLAMTNTVQNSAVWAIESEGKGPFTFACDALMDMDGHMDAFYGPGMKTPATMSTPIHLTLPMATSSATSVRKSLFRKIPKEAREIFDWNAMAKLDRKLLLQPHEAFVDLCRSGETSSPTSPADEGFFEGGNNRVSSPLPDEAVTVEINQMSSKFSTTTTSTSNYVEVTEPSDWLEHDAASQESWSTLFAPDTMGYIPSQVNQHRPRRLKKKRRTGIPNAPASPVEVLSRDNYAYHVAPPPDGERVRAEGNKADMVKKAVRCCLDGVRRCARHEDERWVNVEVKQMVIQKLV